MTHLEQIEGAIWGTAVGDAIGLPAEGLSRKKIAKRTWNNQPWKHRLCFGKGMWSDDTEHTFMVGNAILESGGDCLQFEKALARKFRWWLIAFPAGVGLATARACFKLWLGFSPRKSGVFSAGNGPAMRSGVIGAVFANDEPKRLEFVKTSTKMTHSDPKAVTAALAIAETVAFACRNRDLHQSSKREWIATLVQLGEDEWKKLIVSVCDAADQPTSEFAKVIGCENGVSGYAYRTVPIALHAWMVCEENFRTAIESVINCGGDTDTCAAITGALCGAEMGTAKIPTKWKTDLKEWPRSKVHLHELAEKLASNSNEQVHYPWIFLPLRNLSFLIIVISHGVARLVR